MKYENTIPHVSPATQQEHVAGQINADDVTIITRPSGHNSFDVCMLAPMRDDKTIIWLDMAYCKRK